MNGKFEYCESEHVAAVLYDICGNGMHEEELSFGHDYVDWYARIIGKKNCFIVHENNAGFFCYEVYSIDEGNSLWCGLLDEYESMQDNTFYSELDGRDAFGSLY